jgi:hypothetical protein
LKPTVLRSNAVPLYRFLSTIADDLGTEPTPSRRRILDCSAGGALPPMTESDWKGLYREIQPACSEAAWMARYDQRTTEARYVHTFYVLQKP